MQILQFICVMVYWRQSFKIKKARFDCHSYCYLLVVLESGVNFHAQFLVLPNLILLSSGKVVTAYRVTV